MRAAPLHLEWLKDNGSHWYYTLEEELFRGCSDWTVGTTNLRISWMDWQDQQVDWTEAADELFPLVERALKTSPYPPIRNLLGHMRVLEGLA